MSKLIRGKKGLSVFRPLFCCIENWASQHEFHKLNNFTISSNSSFPLLNTCKAIIMGMYSELPCSYDHAHTHADTEYQSIEHWYQNHFNTNRSNIDIKAVSNITKSILISHPHQLSFYQGIRYQYHYSISLTTESIGLWCSFRISYS